jgi:hypothetical protein
MDRINSAAKSLVKALITLLLAAAPAAYASTASTDITGMWWVPTESGWGVNITLQNDLAFATFFVYDAQRNPIWYTAQMQYQGADSSGALIWTGPMYQTHGDPFTGASSSANTTISQVGTATFRGTYIEAGTLTYSVNGVQITKNVQRQTWRNENYAGSYVGGYSIRFTNCVPSSLNSRQDIPGTISISHSGTSFSARLSATSGVCTFNGSYTQSGNLGDVSGNYTCTDGTQGTFDFFEITRTISGFNGRAVGQNQYCRWSGYFGGIQTAQ